MNTKRILRFILSELKNYIVSLLVEKKQVTRRNLEAIVPQNKLLVIDMIDDIELGNMAQDLSALMPQEDAEQSAIS